MASTGAVHQAQNNNDVSYTAKTAISEGYIVKMDSTANTVALGAAETDKIFAVAQNTVTTAGYPLTVRTAGYARIKAGTGGFSREQYITSDASGTGIDTTTASHIVIGVAEETVSAGEYGEVRLITPCRYDSL